MLDFTATEIKICSQLGITQNMLFAEWRDQEELESG